MSDNSTNNKKTVFLKDYEAPAFLVKTLELCVDINDEATSVSATSQIIRGEGTAKDTSLVLMGEAMELKEVTLDGELLTIGQQYEVDEQSLIIHNVPNAFSLTIKTELKPALNTSLMGMYQSSGNVCTQCEAEGFRKITYFVDRPDNLAVYTTKIVADKTKFPILLSNGNLVDAGELDNNRHWATWYDPYPKPSYLFALVAGDLAKVSDEFTTMSGRKVALNIYVQHHNADQCEHALKSLVNSMRWDEEVYGREYDLDIYNVVAVDDFNMGAMENKGLNIFNSKYVLANQNTATDTDYQNIEGIIGHEYFHNWSGNRVTCRDWFQLSLKEGFTVFRDQEFSADMTSAAVKRIQDVNILRTVQFREDASPVAHPVRPESYMEINNFYTATVYNKGAEVVRMIHHLLGNEQFRQGTDLYFQRHDGQAVTIEDFVQAMVEVSGIDLTQFKRWYHQAGTPVVNVTTKYDETAQTYQMTFVQSCPPTPESEHKEPFHIPIAMALLADDGRAMPLHLGEDDTGGTTKVLALREQEQTFCFVNVSSRPVPSLLRAFSAPIKLETDLSLEDQYFLMAHDDDPFNRWDANQSIAMRHILDNVDKASQQQLMQEDEAYLDALGKTLADIHVDKSFMALLLTLPNEHYISENMAVIEPLLLNAASQFAKHAIAKRHEQALLALYYENNDSHDYEISPQAIGRRSLKNLCLSYLNELNKAEHAGLAWQQFKREDNMTDVLAAFHILVRSGSAYAQQAIERFYETWQDETVVLDKWFQVQAVSPQPGGVERIRQLMSHPKFSMKNPNKVRALIGAFTQGNFVNFHQEDGAGYELLGDCIVELDEINPQVAARLVGSLGLWRRYNERRQLLMKNQLERIINRPKISRDSYDVVQRLLA